MKKNKPFGELFYRSLKKIILTMRIAVIFMILGILQARANDAYSQKTRLSLSFSETELVKVLEKIEVESEFFFLYNEKLLDTDRKVSITANDKLISVILDDLFAGTDVKYTFIDRKIILAPDYLTEVSPPQQVKISGTVTDASTGEALPGVNVVVRGTTLGVMTDVTGNYTLEVPNASATLQFSFIGYLTQEIAVAGKTVINVALAGEVTGLEEVVVVGYGTQRKTSLTASVGTVSSNVMKNINVSNASNALVGRIPGIITVQTSGEIGKDQTLINIRGVGTIGNNKPLIVIDGVPRNSLNEIDINNVESYTVLKDAAAVAPYGMSGANGVILITTKTGKTGKPILEYNNSIGFHNPTVLPDNANAYEYVRAFNQAQINVGIPESQRKFSSEQIDIFKRLVEGDNTIDRNLYANTNSYDYLLQRNAPTSKHAFSASGGTEFVKYYTGINYFNEEGNYQKSNLNRYGIIAKIDILPTDKTKIGLSINGFDQRIKNPPSANNIGGIFRPLLAWIPIYPVYYTNGLLATSHPSGRFDGILPDLINNGYINTDRNSIMSQLSIEQQLFTGFKIKGVVSYDWATEHNKTWTEPQSTYYTINTNVTPYTFNEVTNSGKNSLSESFNQAKAYTYQGILSYTHTFGLHDISLLGVAEARNSIYNDFSAGRSGYEISIDELSMGSPNKDLQSNSGGSSNEAQVGYVYRVSYTFNNRYLFEASGRYDGHYYFAPGKKYGFFPAFSFGWRLSEEPFMKRIAILDNFKLRLSWGQAGNLAGTPNQYSNLFTLYGNAFPFSNSSTQGVYTTTEGNPNITWEKASKTNLGFDFSLWKGLLSGEVDVYYDYRNNMLLSPNESVPTEYGIKLGQVNAGRMDNRGIDLLLKSTKQFSNGLNANLTFTFTYARNKLIEVFENEATRNDPNRTRTGNPYNALYGLVGLRLFQVSDDINGDGLITVADGFPEQKIGGVLQPGSILYEDVNGDGVITQADEKKIGYPATPEIIYSITPGLSWKGFDINLMLQGTGHSSISMGTTYINAFIDPVNYTKFLLNDSWTPENPNARFTKMRPTGSTNNDGYSNSTYYMLNGSYLRVKFVDFGYSLPKAWLAPFSISSFRLYFSGVNLLTWSETMKMFDPEINESSRGNLTARGWYHPQQKVVSFGVNVTF